MAGPVMWLTLGKECGASNQVHIDPVELRRKDVVDKSQVVTIDSPATVEALVLDTPAKEKAPRASVNDALMTPQTRTTVRARIEHLEGKLTRYHNIEPNADTLTALRTGKTRNMKHFKPTPVAEVSAEPGKEAAYKKVIEEPERRLRRKQNAFPICLLHS
ncbi:hypothetical protein BDZ91DRAFT_848414 [Kalaharituber pfeilii]|nr:hypothetical protein BDZ91DRAFT_848414 [Kalaharituber pfeilii]